MLVGEPLIRGMVALSAMLVMAAWERFAPRRALTLPRTVRWPANLGLAITNAVLVRGLFPTAAMGVAVMARQHHCRALDDAVQGVMSASRAPLVTASARHPQPVGVSPARGRAGAFPQRGLPPSAVSIF